MSDPSKPKPEPARLRDWTELLEPVRLPPEFVLALGSGRPELLDIVKTPLDADQARAVAHGMKVLLETNLELQRHSQQVADMAEQALGHMKGLMRKLAQLEDFASFGAGGLGGEEDDTHA